MTNLPKLLFDECVGKPLVDHLRELLTMAVPVNNADTYHILEIYKSQGTLDDVWVPYLAKEGFVVISQDLGRGGGAKLPKLCLEYGITHAHLSPAMGSRKKLEKFMSIISVWYDLLNLHNEPPGTRYFIEPNGDGKAKLVKKLTTIPGQPPAPPGKLFAT